MGLMDLVLGALGSKRGRSTALDVVDTILGSEEDNRQNRGQRSTGTLGGGRGTETRRGGGLSRDTGKVGGFGKRKWLAQDTLVVLLSDTRLHHVLDGLRIPRKTDSTYDRVVEDAIDEIEALRFSFEDAREILYEYVRQSLNGSRRIEKLIYRHVDLVSFNDVSERLNEVPKNIPFDKKFWRSKIWSDICSENR